MNNIIEKKNLNTYILKCWIRIDFKFLESNLNLSVNNIIHVYNLTFIMLIIRTRSEYINEF